MDIQGYSKAFDAFILEMEKVREPVPEKLYGIFEEVCGYLSIGRIEMLYFDNNELSGGNGHLVLYQIPEAAKNCGYENDHVSDSGTMFTFRIYSSREDIVWTEEVLEKIKVFETVLYTFHGRLHLRKYVEKSMLYDRELGVPNMRVLFKDLTNYKEIGIADSYEIGFINLSKFTIVNQCVGRELGTKVMALYIHTLQDKIADNGKVYRVGGDNFIVLFKDELFSEICNYLVRTEVIYEDETQSSVIVKANMGVYDIQDNNFNIDVAIEKAHIALQSARKSTEKSYVIFDKFLQEMSEKENIIERIFNDAIENEEFMVYYQPKVQLSNYEIAGAEALCRWKHEGKLIPPNDFIPVLEQGNSICILDFYMLDHVCRDIRRWLDEGYKVVKVSVNMSRRHMGDHKLLEKILSIIDSHNVPHSYIEIELTETTTDVGFYDLQQIVFGLHENGIHTSVDDFGVGYSSLNLIRQVPWDVIKIDKSFLPEVFDRNSSQYILFGHLLSMFKALGLKCIVEGVETIEQVKMLKENNCYMAQGYYFDRPLPVDEFEKRICN